MRRMKVVCALVVLLSFGSWLGASAQQCGGDKLCADTTLCCSKWSYCGTGKDYCGDGCQNGPCWTSPPPPPAPAPPVPPAPPGQADITDIISASLFEDLLMHRNDPACEGNGFFSYYAFVTAARAFPGFGTTGNDTIRKKELASFFGQTSHETTGGWDDAPDGPFAWGYCFIRERDQSDPHCSTDYPQWPCFPGQKYFGRGPIQLSYNYNYGPAGEALGVDLLSNADLVATDPVLSFETAIWFWMTPQGNKPSCHDVVIDQWRPSANDVAAGRVPGYGVLTNIINGGIECGSHVHEDTNENRIGFYKRYCDIYDIEYGDNLDCYDQKPFNSGVKLSDQM